jgi:hypothetical protein
MATTLGQALALLTNFIKGWKCLPGIIAPAQLATSSVTKKKSFVTLTPGRLRTPPATFAGNRPAGNQKGVKNMNLKCPKVSSKLTLPKFIKVSNFWSCTSNS